MPSSRLSCLLAIALLMFAAACKKDGQHGDSGTPVANAVTPSTFHPGDTLTIRGNYLGIDPTKIQVTLNDTITLSIIKAADSVVTVVLPPAAEFAFWGSRPFKVTFTLNGTAIYTATFTITVSEPEPKGWFTVATLPGLNTLLALASIEIMFPTDSIGYYLSYDGLRKTRDGGETWQTTPGSLTYVPSVISVLDTSHLWYGTLDFRIFTSNDGGSSWQDHPLPAYLVAGGGIYLSSPTTGKIVDANGRIYNVAGSFDTTSGMLPEHTSPYAFFGNYGGGLSVYTGFSAIDDNNLMMGGAGGNYGGASVTVKTNGVYDDYPVAVTTWPLTKVLLVNTTLGFAIDTKNNLLKYTGNRTWGLLPQTATAVYFVNATTGYIADDKRIYLTQDGGESWNPVFNLSTGDHVYNITGHNGKVWAIGNHQGSGGAVGFIYKYNP